MSTLRCDNEHAPSPLIEYVLGAPWPPVDPDMIDREEYEYDRIGIIIRFLFGRNHTEEVRTRYNASRPFSVLGGISDGECQLLQCARGGYAKVTLCSMWLQEFITREQMNGSTGNVAPPIVSRSFQEISQGMLG
mmetsp:Transcript_30555/g.45207  ORF Transcript_30555/g.45207 Transcript_30555/m.45207 type:complete len:134 (-) Transcript_30555:9-410(-)